MARLWLSATALALAASYSGTVAASCRLCRPYLQNAYHHRFRWQELRSELDSGLTAVTSAV